MINVSAAPPVEWGGRRHQASERDTPLMGPPKMTARMAEHLSASPAGSTKAPTKKASKSPMPKGRRSISPRTHSMANGTTQSSQSPHNDRVVDQQTLTGQIHFCHIHGRRKFHQNAGEHHDGNADHCFNNNGFV